MANNKLKPESWKVGRVFAAQHFWILQSFSWDENMQAFMSRSQSAEEAAAHPVTLNKPDQIFTLGRHVYDLQTT